MLQYFCSVSKVHIGKGTWWFPTKYTNSVGLRLETRPLLVVDAQLVDVTQTTTNCTCEKGSENTMIKQKLTQQG